MYATARRKVSRGMQEFKKILLMAKSPEVLYGRVPVVSGGTIAQQTVVVLLLHWQVASFWP